MSTRGVRTNWDLVAKIKVLKSQNHENEGNEKATPLNIDEKALALYLKMKEQEFNNHVPTSEEDVLNHPTMISKYLKKFFKWTKPKTKQEKEN
jgi:hypothetical protein